MARVWRLRELPPLDFFHIQETEACEIPFDPGAFFPLPAAGFPFVVDPRRIDGSRFLLLLNHATTYWQ